MKKNTILIIDDDRDICESLEAYLTMANMQVVFAHDGLAGLRAFYKHQPDLVLLDIMMPRMSGWEVGQQIQQLSDVPIIMLTASARENDMIRGFDNGAVDYVTKPFNLKALAARIRSVLRRTIDTPAATSPDYSDGSLVIDSEKRKVLVGGQIIPLSPQDFDLLLILLENSDQVVTVENILKHMRGSTIHQNSGYVRSRIWLLRRKIERDPARPVYIHTERGIGYRFEKIRSSVS